MSECAGCETQECSALRLPRDHQPPMLALTKPHLCFSQGRLGGKLQMSKTQLVRKQLDFQVTVFLVKNNVTRLGCGFSIEVNEGKEKLMKKIKVHRNPKILFCRRTSSKFPGLENALVTKRDLFPSFRRRRTREFGFLRSQGFYICSYGMCMASERQGVGVHALQLEYGVRRELAGVSPPGLGSRD